MGVWDKLSRALGFAQERSEFELLETEPGSPTFFGGWAKRKGASEETGKPKPGGPGKRPQPTAVRRGPAGHVYEKEEGEEQGRDIPAVMEDAIKLFRCDFRADINPDLIIRRFNLGGVVSAAAVFINGMAKGEAVNDFILREGMRPECMTGAKRPYVPFILNNVFSYNEISTAKSWDKAKSAVLDGMTVVLIDGEQEAVIADTRGYEHRGVAEAQNEKVVRGPQEGFTENMRTNITLLRRIIRREDLVCEIRASGGENHLKVSILYLDGTANESLVNDIKRRLAQVDTRLLMGAGVLEQLIETHQLSPFPQLLSTERPDRAAAYLMQGYVAVLLEGSPFANIMPTTLWALMASSEDSYLRRPEGNVVRVVRYLGAIVSIILPGYFLSLALYHQGMLSTEALSTLIASREMVFAPLGMELLFLLAVFQLIREAGLRVPGSIGQAIGIIGGLILGQAAVSANLASSIILIIVALSGLGNFCIPDYSTQISASYLRLVLAASAWLAGLLGIACTITITLAAMAKLKSYGVPFLSPVAPKTYSKQPAILRGPMRMHKRATDFTNTHARGGAR